MINLKKIIAIGVVASSALILSACNLYKTPSSKNNQNQQTSGEQAPLTASGVISYTASGFSPAQVTVKVGQSVEFKNSSDSNVQVNSAVHPTHELFPELNIGVIALGESTSVTFTKAGTYKYHNHLNASQTGQIVVE
ncbi:hypothetical protein A2W45_03445 [Candidatus Curtissbacteria bacterium RIFCSPHIGHO2_12_41_11]|uniref:EfeO-type cupredoxin-like domain-containing protein n=3 Tax=Candidatus Curtissiibacteriota TaxID=1752717 RepID=A0A1F5HT36_9BACT|nr:MAG: hypothetical protein UU56_C0008G0075 [Candidatus Curtissbacteria bacterium GW2011_GWA2_41_24]OGD98510.1 MAG: hypothetical protein A2W45_03445 [Candidatus Curtissbacteria bacterium RIFCSPHIGHO2_12_41_11]OGE07371.1 MAG: hypothetical protein A2W70_03200 [Candidatus Curtissbacteria bacterium RIFCSPLOWO2_02_41_11]